MKHLYKVVATSGFDGHFSCKVDKYEILKETPATIKTSYSTHRKAILNRIVRCSSSPTLIMFMTYCLEEDIPAMEKGTINSLIADLRMYRTKIEDKVSYLTNMGLWKDYE